MCTIAQKLVGQSMFHHENTGTFNGVALQVDPLDRCGTRKGFLHALRDRSQVVGGKRVEECGKAGPFLVQWWTLRIGLKVTRLGQVPWAQAEKDHLAQERAQAHRAEGSGARD